MGHKRIIDGKTYNTETATLVYEVPRHEDHPLYDGLYQTKHGAFFLYWYDMDREAGDIKPFSDEDAQRWLEKHGAPASVIEQYIGAMPEAGAAETRLTLRLPGNLYHRVVASAAAAEVSVNTHIMRLLERSERPVDG